MARPRRRLPALVIAAALVVAACGDDGGEDAATTASTASTSTAPTDGATEGTDGSNGDVGGEGPDEAPEDAPPDAGAQEPPAERGGDEEGLGDRPVAVGELRGDAEVSGPGDGGASGRIEAQAADDGRWCIDLVVTGLGGEVTDAHLHEAPAGQRGDAVVPIGPPTSTSGGTDTWADVCLTLDVFVEERLLADATGFYAEVHTTDFGDGAVRGQLEPASIFDLTLS